MDYNLIISRTELLLTVFLVAFSSVPAWVHGIRPCREPDRDETIHGSFDLIPSPTYNLNNISSIPLDFINVRRNLIAGETICPSWHASVRRHGGKVCPFHYVLNYDSNRNPRSMVETACNCADCLREDGSANALINCHPTVHHVKVSRRTSCRDGVYVYAEVWEELNVGCQCAHIEHVSDYQRIVSQQ